MGMKFIYSDSEIDDEKLQDILCKIALLFDNWFKGQREEGLIQKIDVVSILEGLFKLDDMFASNLSFDLLLSDEIVSLFSLVKFFFVIAVEDVFMGRGSDEVSD